MMLTSEPSRAMRASPIGHGMLALGHLAANVAVEALVLEEADGVRVADGAGEEALGVGRRCGRDHLQARRLE